MDLLHLRIATPARVVVDNPAVRSVRATDASGSFGVLPGHTELLTVLPASVVAWSDAQGGRHFCVVRGGVLTVSQGQNVTIAGRHAVLGASMEELEAAVIEARRAEAEADRRARMQQAYFHAQAVRHLVQFLIPSARGDAAAYPRARS